MEYLRKRRLEEEREAQMKERLYVLKESILDRYVQLPKTASMDCRPTVQNLLGEKECFDLVMAPTDREVTRNDFSQVLPEVCPRWEARCADELRSVHIVRMRYIVSGLGLDPTRATHEDIKDAWLRCRVCSPSSREVFTWETAFLHSRRVAHGVERDIWEKASEEDMVAIRQLREKGIPPPRDKLKIRWGCTLCRDWDSIGTGVETHLKEEHNKEDWDKCIEDGTLYLHYSQPFPSTYPVVLPEPNGSKTTRI
uniref:Uncharacterized protein n=1 Tax=Ganoderma boninense TaxID=34458 RepID=A0A5K1K790_9APHY|nr:Uncharacterized protein [Ganoderma boninense]